jgi:hypothetical protein
MGWWQLQSIWTLTTAQSCSTQITYFSGRIPTDSGFFQAPDSGLRPSATPESGFG